MGGGKEKQNKVMALQSCACGVKTRCKMIGSQAHIYYK